MITNLITLADFPEFVPFSVNIGAQLVDPHIRQAQVHAVWPLLPTALRTVLATDRASWPAETLTLFTDYVRPLLVVEAAREMLLWHGLHITPNAAEITTDRPISGQQRTELRANLAGKANTYRAALEIALRQAYPSPSATCGAARRRPSSGGLQLSAV